jgi:DNA repair protein RadD
MSLWAHQERGLTQLNASIAAGKRAICLTCPTGGGKTLMLFTHMTSRNWAASVYTDRRMLLAQLAKGMEQSGITFGYRASGYETRLLEDVQLCMIQTEGPKIRDGKRDLHPADIVYVDEAHKNTGDTMLGLIEQHKQREGFVSVWITATPLGLDHVCDELIVAGTNSELRNCGALVPAYHYGPDEPDTKWVGKVAIGEGECGLANNKRMEYATRVFGSVVEHFDVFNPDRRPSLLFAPGVKESIWFAQQLCESGIKAAHIDGNDVWVDGELHSKDQDLVDEVARRHQNGDILCVCNRFVLREGINWPWVYHGIFATIFGSLTSYIQAGGRLLRSHPDKDQCVIQDHGGNWWRHGSLNDDREWKLEYTDRIVAGMREQRIRDRKEREPITCPACHSIRMGGDTCGACGHRHQTKARLVLQKDGSLREMRGDIFRQRRLLNPSQKITEEWCGRVKNVRRSQKPTVQRMTFAQLEVSFARDHNWQYPPRGLPMMPVNETDWYRPVKDVQELT